jgi:RNA polymerase sigma factor (sigma-70 family)
MTTMTAVPAQPAPAPVLAARDDGDLLGASGATSDAAFAELVRRYAGSVRAIGRRVLGAHADADIDDAAQAAFIALARRRGELSRNRSIAAWLHHAAWCAAVDCARARGSRRAYERPLTAAASSEAEARRGLSPDPALVDEALASLHERYRAPIILHHLEEHSHQEGARLLNIPVGTFAGRLSRGRRLLERKLCNLLLDGAARSAPPGAAIRAEDPRPAALGLIATWATDCDDAHRAAALLGRIGSAPTQAVASLASRVLEVKAQASTVAVAASVAPWGAAFMVLSLIGVAACLSLRQGRQEPASAPGQNLAGDHAAPATLSTSQGASQRRPLAIDAPHGPEAPATNQSQDHAMTEIDIVTVAPQHCALVRGRLHRATIGTEIRALFERYYGAAGKIPGKGLNFCIYRDSDAGGLLDQPAGIPVEVGTLFDQPFADRDGLVGGSIPGGRVAHGTLWGDYAGLPALHRRIDAWCAAHGEAESPVRWEIYGHMYDDMSKVRTDVYVALKDAKPGR